VVDLSNVSLSELAAATGNVDFGGYKGVNVADPGANQDAATKKYHDDNKTSDAAEIVSGVFDDARIPAAIARDTEVTSAISTHAGLPSVHHTKYTNAEAVAAIEAEAELDLKLFNSVTQPAAWVFHSAAQATVNGAWTTLTWNNNVYNVGPAGHLLWSPTVNPSRITVAYPGLYYIFAYVLWDSNATGVRMIHIQENGTTSLILSWTHATPSGNQTSQVSAIHILGANDYVEANAYQNSGGALNVLGALQHSGLMVARLH
jgi:hypothetical protein